MFSGIIEGQAKILRIENGRYTIENTFKEPLELGQSIAHDGACMTLESYSNNEYVFFAMEESLSKTNFATKSIWDTFNVERCLKVWDRVDGHFVTGHIDTTGTIAEKIIQDDNSLILGVNFSPSFSKYIIPKGSISINGVSLTIVEKQDDYISVSLIPITQEWTNLGSIDIWAPVNLEFDMLGKYILQK